MNELKLEEGVHLAGELHLATLCHKLGFGDIDVEGIDLPLVDHEHQHQQGEGEEVGEPHDERESLLGGN